MANLTRAMTLTRWADGLALRPTCTLWVPIPGTQVERARGGRYHLNAVNFSVTADTVQGASLLRDLANTSEPLDSVSKQVARELAAQYKALATMATGKALATVLEVAGYQTPTHRQPKAQDDVRTRGPWYAAMPADCGDSFAQCEGISPKVAGIEKRRQVWCKRTERGHNAIVRRRARIEALTDGNGTPCWDGLPALMRKMPS